MTSVDVQRGRIQVATEAGRSVDVPRRYLQLGRLTHGYATTVHKAQGVTIDSALLLVDDQSYREAAYTGLSRGRITNRVFVVTDEHESLDVPRPHEARDDLAILRDAVTRSSAQQLATPRRRVRR
ncbi:MAG: hypothetical protein ACRD1K_01310 [Acidimicrobiales bacterium]